MDFCTVTLAHHTLRKVCSLARLLVLTAIVLDTDRLFFLFFCFF